MRQTGDFRKSNPRLPIAPGEAWADAALADLKQLGSDPLLVWTALLDHCRATSAAKPSGRWSKQAAELLDAVGRAPFREHVLRWFPLVDKPRTEPARPTLPYSPDPSLLIEPVNGDILKGLAWCCSLFHSPDIARALSNLARSAYRKVPGLGPRAVKVGNACVYALGAIPDREALAQLALLKVKVKLAPAQKGIEKALLAAAEREGLPREELEEMVVPQYGLTEVGRRRQTLGDFVAELTVTGTASTELTWLKPDGKRQKSIPAAIKRDHADELQELRATARDLQKMLPAQRDRIDGLFLEQKSWPLSLWRQRYLDHPLVGVIARRLIWRFRSSAGARDGFFHQGHLVDSRGERLPELGDDTVVSMWHPIDKDPSEVVSWRLFLERHELRQPFKQAHREIYLLTDAERRTGVYSNRYAAHVLRQHQFHALCAVRGWRNRLRLLVDDVVPPASLELPRWNLRAEFWIEGAGEEFGTDTNESGTFLYLTTDQVRFYRLGARQTYAHAAGGGYDARTAGADDEPLPLEEIPPLVFSEVMRDVDLFVGVASVGNDPTWSDGGPEGRYRDYWASYSFGELSGTANTRKEVLQRLIPRLKIADRCGFSDRFLEVRGDLRTYKIHLGSGNILMSPNDQYLCIVPDRRQQPSGDKVFLPFEGDNMLSIILSKALMLADDRNIRDETITSQIRAG